MSNLYEANNRQMALKTTTTKIVNTKPTSQVNYGTSKYILKKKFCQHNQDQINVTVKRRTSSERMQPKILEITKKPLFVITQYVIKPFNGFISKGFHFKSTKFIKAKFRNNV